MHFDYIMVHHIFQWSCFGNRAPSMQRSKRRGCFEPHFVIFNLQNPKPLLCLAFISYHRRSTCFYIQSKNQVLSPQISFSVTFSCSLRLLLVIFSSLLPRRPSSNVSLLSVPRNHCAVCVPIKRLARDCSSSISASHYQASGVRP